MAKESLVKEDFDAGGALIEFLQASKVKVSAALWLWFPDVKTWRLLIASPSVDSEGPLEFYKKVQKVLASHSEKTNKLELIDIGAISPEHPFAKASVEAIRRGSPESNLMASGSIESSIDKEAWLYRTAKTASY